jgi:hypothetical protein
MFRLTELGLHHGLLVVGRDGTEREGIVLQRCALLQYGGAAAGVSRRWRASVLGRNTTGFCRESMRTTAEGHDQDELV